MRAQDVMTRPVITASPETSLLEIVQLMLDQRISALPIIAEDGSLVGIVSEGDLMRRAELGVQGHSSWWLAALGGKVRLADEFVKIHGMKAGDIMTHNVISVGPDTQLPEIAETLERKHIKRVPVIEDGSVVGIVSRANLLQALAMEHKRLEQIPSPSDREIREKLLEVLKSQSWSELSQLNFVVRDGIVYYWGNVRTDAARQALKAAAVGIPGVRDVVDHMRKPITLI